MEEFLKALDALESNLNDLFLLSRIFLVFVCMFRILLIILVFSMEVNSSLQLVPSTQ